MIRIYIPTIIAYCGGTVALACLCQTLRSMGYDARLLLVPYFPCKKVNRNKYLCDYFKNIVKYFSKRFIKKLLSYIFPNASFTKHYQSKGSILSMEGIKIQWDPFISKDSIVIYSEDIYGNPLGCKHVVRWLLYYYEYINTKGAHSENDLFIAYREVFNNQILNPEKHIVTVTYFNNKLYRQYNFDERKGICYIIHKGKDRNDLPLKFDGPVFNSNMSQEDLVYMLNSHKYCYCYDPQTFYMKIAAVCGCIPVLVMEPNKTEADYLSSSESHYGIAYGDTQEQIEYAINTREQCLRSLDFTQQNKLNVTRLVKILESRFGQIERINKYDK